MHQSDFWLNYVGWPLVANILAIVFIAFLGWIFRKAISDIKQKIEYQFGRNGGVQFTPDGQIKGNPTLGDLMRRNTEDSAKSAKDSAAALSLARKFDAYSDNTAKRLNAMEIQLKDVIEEQRAVREELKKSHHHE